MSSQNQDPKTLVEEARRRPTYRNPMALELSPLEFQQWRHNPITAAFLLFLAHRRDSLARDAAELYIAGQLEDADKQGLRGRMMELEELCTMELGGMWQFYGKEPDSKPDQGSKTK